MNVPPSSRLSPLLFSFLFFFFFIFVISTCNVMFLAACIQRIINLVTGLLATHDFNPFIVHGSHRSALAPCDALKFPLAYKFIYDPVTNIRGRVRSLQFSASSWSFPCTCAFTKYRKLIVSKMIRPRNIQMRRLILNRSREQGMVDLRFKIRAVRVLHCCL